MDDPDIPSIEGATSYLSLPKENEEEEKTDPLAPAYPTWSTRWKCCQCYICFGMSTFSMLNFYNSVLEYGCAIFIPYLIFTFILVIPCALVEILFGRYGTGNVLRAWTMCTPGKSLFACLYVVTAYFTVNRNLLNVFILKYFFSCFYGRLRWENCNDYWAKENCYVIGGKNEAFYQCLETHSREYCENLKWESSGIQYWKYVVTNERDVVEVIWSVCCLLVIVFVTIAFSFKRINGLEKALGLLIYPVVFLWTIIWIVSLSIPGALKTFMNICDFNWNHFMSYNMWITGFQDIVLYSGVGNLSLSFISSHGKFTDNIFLDVLVVSFISVTSCLMISAPFLGTIKSFKDHIKPPLIHSDDFQIMAVISEAFLIYPFPNALWAALYCLVMFLMSIGTQIISVLTLSEATEAILNTKKRWLQCLLLICVIPAVLALVIYITKIIIAHLATAVAVNVLITTITWQFFYGIGNFKSDYHFMMGYPVPLFIRCTWIILLPLQVVLLLLQIFFTKNDVLIMLHTYSLSVFVILIFTLVLLYQIILIKKQKGKFSMLFTLNPNWGPEHPLLKKSRKLFGTSTVTREFTYRQELNKKHLIKPPEFSSQNIVCVI